MKKLFYLLILLLGLLSCKDDDDIQHQVDCNSLSKFISGEKFELINTNNYKITQVNLIEDCLEIEVVSSGCDPESWKMNLYSSKNYSNDNLLKNKAKMELINDQLCEAIFHKSMSFDLAPFRINEANEVTLLLDGWDKPIIYKY